MNKKTPKFSEGIECKKNTYVEFGKFMIQTKFLNDNILLVKYKSYAPVPTIKRTNVSSLFSSIIQDLLISKEINYKLLSELDEKEQLLFTNLLNKSGLTNTLNYDKRKVELSASKLVEKYNILKGQIVAGNNNPEIMKDIEELLPKLVNVKRITQETADEILELIKDL